MHYNDRQYKSETEIIRSDELKYFKYNRVNYSVLAGVRLVYLLNKIALSCSPELYYSLLPASKYAFIGDFSNEKLCTHGVKLSIVMH